MFDIEKEWKAIITPAYKEIDSLEVKYKNFKFKIEAHDNIPENYARLNETILKIEEIFRTAITELACRSFKYRLSKKLSNPLITISPQDAIKVYLLEKKSIAVSEINEDLYTLLIRCELLEEAATFHSRYDFRPSTNTFSEIMGKLLTSIKNHEEKNLQLHEKELPDVQGAQPECD